MAELIAGGTCLVHPNRPAIARCPSCNDTFCGECITEHEGRLTCASCLAAAEQKAEGAGVRWKLRVPFAAILQITVALIVVWLLFMVFGQT
ncbi:MAG: hypothetical protein AAGC68_03735, partial [Verrucomicrobiota bacterium]